MKRHLFIYIISLAIVTQMSVLASSRDGEIFDGGYSMKVEAASAPAELKNVRYFIGQWDVEVTHHFNDTTLVTSQGRARFSYMNRGHAIFERLEADNFDGNENLLSTVTFYVFNKAANMWNVGIANSLTENVSVYNGEPKGSDLQLFNSIRKNGGVSVVHYRLSYHHSGENEFTVTLEESLDNSGEWKVLETKNYSRRVAEDGFLSGSGFGEPSAAQPTEARGFDFLVGEWTANHEMNLGGRWIKSPQNATAVHVLDGKGVMEYNWHNLDPNLPDAATSIVRIYNRAMRRWENMYTTNRSNSILYFGGYREGDKIILSSFESDASSPSISYYIFHDIKENDYLWHAEVSTDHGKTFTETWKIHTARN